MIDMLTNIVRVFYFLILLSLIVFGIWILKRKENILVQDLGFNNESDSFEEDLITGHKDIYAPENTCERWEN